MMEMSVLWRGLHSVSKEVATTTRVRALTTSHSLIQRTLELLSRNTAEREGVAAQGPPPIKRVGSRRNAAIQQSSLLGRYVWWLLVVHWYPHSGCVLGEWSSTLMLAPSCHSAAPLYNGREWRDARHHLSQIIQGRSIVSPSITYKPHIHHILYSFVATKNELHDFSPDKEPLLSMLEGEIQAMYMCKPGEYPIHIQLYSPVWLPFPQPLRGPQPTWTLGNCPGTWTCLTRTLRW